MSSIRLKPISETPSTQDGIRILAERKWPRGVSKEKAGIDFWMKEIAPSEKIKTWLDGDSSRWDEFRKKYWKELSRNKALAGFRQHLKGITVTLVFSARNDKQSPAIALKEFLSRKP